ncbi:MAG: hypothetical protein AB1611_07295 [bacterium]
MTVKNKECSPFLPVAGTYSPAPAGHLFSLAREGAYTPLARGEGSYTAREGTYTPSPLRGEGWGEGPAWLVS